MRLPLILLVVLVFRSTKASDDEQDYSDDDEDDGGQKELVDCRHEIDFKALKSNSPLLVCSALQKPAAGSRIQLNVFANHTEGKIRVRAFSSSASPSVNRSLIELTTDIVDDLSYPTSLLVIDQFQMVPLPTLKAALQSLTKVDFGPLEKYLKKTLVLLKGGHKHLLTCSGNAYPKQKPGLFNLTGPLAAPITCSKQQDSDVFFAIQEKIYFQPKGQSAFRLSDLHQDDQSKVSRTSSYTCSHPKSCTLGVQAKAMLDKTTHYVQKFLEKSRTEKKPPSG